MSKEAMPGNTHIEGSTLKGDYKVVLVDSKVDERGRQKLKDNIARINARIEALAPFDMDITKAELIAQGYTVTRIKAVPRPKGTPSAYLPDAGRKTRRSHKTEGYYASAKSHASAREGTGSGMMPTGEMSVFEGSDYFPAGGWHVIARPREDNYKEIARENKLERASLEAWEALKRLS